MKPYSSFCPRQQYTLQCSTFAQFENQKNLKTIQIERYMLDWSCANSESMHCLALWMEFSLYITSIRSTKYHILYLQAQKEDLNSQLQDYATQLCKMYLKSVMKICLTTPSQVSSHTRQLLSFSQTKQQTLPSNVQAQALLKDSNLLLLLDGADCRYQ